jgi:haloacetate dehalogenase
MRSSVRAIHDPATVTAMLEDYRAGVGIDRAHEEAHRAVGAARHLPAPRPVVQPRRPGVPLWRSAVGVAPLATDLRGGHSIDSGCHMAEEAPDELAAALIELLRVR